MLRYLYVPEGEDGNADNVELASRFMMPMIIGLTDAYSLQVADPSKPCVVSIPSVRKFLMRQFVTLGLHHVVMYDDEFVNMRNEQVVLEVVSPTGTKILQPLIREVHHARWVFMTEHTGLHSCDVVINGEPTGLGGDFDVQGF
jgi:hypothetical protein